MQFPNFVRCGYFGLSNYIFAYNPKLLEEAFQNGLHPDRGTCFLSLVHESPTYTKLGLKYGADPEKTDSQGEKALGFATHHSQIEVVKILIESGVDVNSIEHYSCGEKATALDCANHNKEIFSYLKSIGALTYQELKK